MSCNVIGYSFVNIGGFGYFFQIPVDDLVADEWEKMAVWFMSIVTIELFYDLLCGFEKWECYSCPGLLSFVVEPWCMVNTDCNIFICQFGHVGIGNSGVDSKQKYFS